MAGDRRVDSTKFNCSSRHTNRDQAKESTIGDYRLQFKHALLRTVFAMQMIQRARMPRLLVCSYTDFNTENKIYIGDSMEYVLKTTSSTPRAARRIIGVSGSNGSFHFFLGTKTISSTNNFPHLSPSFGSISSLEITHTGDILIRSN